MRLRPEHPKRLDLTDYGAPGFYINDMDTVVKPGGIHYKSYRDSLDFAAKSFAWLEGQGVTILLELFNEFNGRWNWMGNASPEEFRKLWRYTFDTFAKEHQLSNLLFVLEYSGGATRSEKTPAADYYPGDDAVDIVGFDFYDDDPKNGFVDVYSQILALGKPIAMTEYGPRDEPKMQWDNMIQVDFTKKHYPEIRFFIRWQQNWAIASQKNAGPFMADPWWVHLGQLAADPACGWKPKQP
jgi:beta-mannanase